MKSTCNRFDYVKSNFIIISIFSKLNNSKKLQLIRYNKYLQSKIGITIDDFKKESGVYKIIQKNGKGQEFSLETNRLIFEGEYLNGKRNGKGKEYDRFGQLLFEGIYLNGKKWTGKGYDKYGKDKIILELNNGKGEGQEYGISTDFDYEGEFLNGERNGKGKEYSNYKLIFEGEFLNGKRNGKGKEYDNDKLIFEGEYLNGKRWTGKGYNINGDTAFEIKDGKGNVKLFRYGNYLFFEGEYINGEKNGKGKDFYTGRRQIFYDVIKENGENIYEGTFYTFRQELRFEGEYLNGERNGKGKEYYLGGIKQFEGEYLNGKRWSGKGYDPKDRSVILELNNGKGKGKEYTMNGEKIYEGEYLNGEKNGKGKQYNRYGGLYYKGEYLNGKRSGKGKEFNTMEDKEDKLTYEGEYFNDKKSGKGKEYDYEGKNLVYEGEYLNDKKHGIGKEYENGKLIYEGEFIYDRHKDDYLKQKRKDEKDNELE